MRFPAYSLRSWSLFFCLTGNKNVSTFMGNVKKYNLLSPSLLRTTCFQFTCVCWILIAGLIVTRNRKHPGLLRQLHVGEHREQQLHQQDGGCCGVHCTRSLVWCLSCSGPLWPIFFVKRLRESDFLTKTKIFEVVWLRAEFQKCKQQIQNLIHWIIFKFQTFVDQKSWFRAKMS